MHQLNLANQYKNQSTFQVNTYELNPYMVLLQKEQDIIFIYIIQYYENYCKYIFLQMQQIQLNHYLQEQSYIFYQQNFKPLIRSQDWKIQNVFFILI
ncbi:hypothetical protein pb186bvf_015915 [Paramecium bursaria]